MCYFHRESDVNVVKVRYKSKLRRDAERMNKFQEQKAMSIFPCVEFYTIELMDFFPTLDYNKEFKDNVRLRYDRVHSERVTFEIKSIHYEKKFKELKQEYKSVVRNLENLQKQGADDKIEMENYRKALLILMFSDIQSDVKPSNSNINHNEIKKICGIESLN
ncbi:Hypothetical predicted protein [Mytilus galloprovincialis]|uniref:Uncharacterized protein n=1 Tax=Mytilus galloprovincialis TaxID=29158 RepID=A0A8B6F0W0_MYTGA|nr:Hypothetical predicted protein [Mytilus galloprovincialis]